MDIRRILIVGPRKSGKTALRALLSQGIFPEEYEATEGMCYSMADLQGNRIVLCDLSEGMQLTSGFSFRVIWVVFDLAYSESFEQCKSLYEQIKNLGPVVLIGNKKDLAQVVESEQIRRFVNDNSCPYLEISCASCVGVDLLVSTVITKYFC